MAGPGSTVPRPIEIGRALRQRNSESWRDGSGGGFGRGSGTDRNLLETWQGRAELAVKDRVP